MTTIRLPYPPSANRYYRYYRGRILIAPQGRAYKEFVAALCRTARVEPIPGPVALEITARRPNNGKRDLDNLLKPLCDALKHRAFGDDSEIASISIRWGGLFRPHGDVTVKVEPFEGDE